MSMTDLEAIAKFAFLVKLGFGGALLGIGTSILVAYVGKDNIMAMKLALASLALLIPTWLAARIVERLQ